MFEESSDFLKNRTLKRDILIIYFFYSLTVIILYALVFGLLKKLRRNDLCTGESMVKCCVRHSMCMMVRTIDVRLFKYTLYIDVCVCMIFLAHQYDSDNHDDLFCSTNIANECIT